MKIIPKSKIIIILDGEESLREVIFDPRFLSPSGNLIKFGQYSGDHLSGWFRLDEITIVEVLETMESQWT